MGFGNVVNFRNQGVRDAFERRVRAGLAAVGVADPQVQWQGVDPEESAVIFYVGGLSVTEMDVEPGVFYVEAFAAAPGGGWEPAGGDLVELGRFHNATEAAYGFAGLYARMLVDNAITASDEVDYAAEFAAAPTP